MRDGLVYTRGFVKTYNLGEYNEIGYWAPGGA